MLDTVSELRNARKFYKEGNLSDLDEFVRIVEYVIDLQNMVGDLETRIKSIVGQFDSLIREESENISRIKEGVDAGLIVAKHLMRYIERLMH